MASNEIIIHANLAKAKQFVDQVLGKMGFRVTYSAATEAIAERGSGLVTVIAGPFSGKKQVAVKMKVSYSEHGDTTYVYITDQTSSLQKVATLTGGKTKKIMDDVLNELQDGLRLAGII